MNQIPHQSLPSSQFGPIASNSNLPPGPMSLPPQAQSQSQMPPNQQYNSQFNQNVGQPSSTGGPKTEFQSAPPTMISQAPMQSAPHFPNGNFQQQQPPPMLQPPNNVAYLPNTIMTTQVQSNQPPIGNQQHMPSPHAVHVSPMHQNHMQPPMPNHMAAINHPVTSTILPSSDQRSNIPVYQQQR